MSETNKQFSSLRPSAKLDHHMSAKLGHPVWSLFFDCPDCGAPHRVGLLIHDQTAKTTDNIWEYSMPEDSWESFSLYPSVVCEGHVTKSCDMHTVVRHGVVMGCGKPDKHLIPHHYQNYQKQSFNESHMGLHDQIEQDIFGLDIGLDYSGESSHAQSVR